MTSQARRLGILTSGGDCAGMNSAVSAVVKMAIYHGYETFVIREGFAGLVKGNQECTSNETRAKMNLSLIHI